MKTPDRPSLRCNEVTLVQVISALLIVNYHTAMLSVPYFRALAKFGFLFNTVFVLLSGFLLARSLSDPAAFRARTFFRRRILRIYPPYYVSLALIGLIEASMGCPVSPRSVALALTGFSYFFGVHAFGIHLWFVSVILVCYFLFYPTLLALRSVPLTTLALQCLGFGLLVFLREGTLAGAYAKVSDDPSYRLAFHYIAFSLGVYVAITRGSLRLLGGPASLAMAVVSLLVFQWSHADKGGGALTIASAVMSAMSLVSLAHWANPLVQDRLPQLFWLAPVTYELYLIHYSVIEFLDHHLHGRYLAYALVFPVSIALAVLVRGLTDALKSTAGLLTTRRPLGSPPPV